MRIHTIDLEFQGSDQAIAAYLISDAGANVLVETGPSSCREALLAGLAGQGLEPADVDHVLVTHIHLDHAGAAGWWSRQGPTVWVHELGAPHLLDPAKLVASATRIYGDEMDRLWGEIVPADPARLRTLADGDRVTAGALVLEAIDTPGHARHHHVFRLGDVAFTGDAAGVRIPGTDWVDVPAPPPEFDLGAWNASLERLRGERFARIYPTHFGEVEEPLAQLDALEAQLHSSVAFVRERLAAGEERDAVVASYRDWVRRRADRAGVPAGAADRLELANPRDMSVDGIARYLRKRAA